MGKLKSKLPDGKKAVREGKPSAFQKKVEQIMTFLDSTQMFFLLLAIPFIIIAPY